MENYAFISYSHEDIKAVRKLHKKLESFRIPRMVRKKVKGCPKRLHPIFRDETDLSGVTLTPMIRTALENSAFLIVVCTKSSERSVWVQREIETFLQYHDPSHIIPVFLDEKTKRTFKNGFTGMLSALNCALENSVFYRPGHRKYARFEIITKLLQCYSFEMGLFYRTRRYYLGIALVFVWLILGAILFSEINWLYKEDHLITEYCRDISFDYDWPTSVDPLAEDSLPVAGDYYICTYHKNRIVKVEKVSSDDSEDLPGSFLLEADCMEFYYNNFWRSTAQVSRVVYRNKEGQVLFVKDFALDQRIADLTVAPDSWEPFYLPGDMTCSTVSSSEDPAFSCGCRIAQLYDEAGRVNQIWFLTDTFSYYMCDQNGYFGITYIYDESGELVSVQYLDIDGTVLKTYPSDTP